MATISVCMIVKDEEQVLRRCLDSLKGLWDELIIVDTGSSDKTKEIASEYTDKVYDFKWVGDFSKARNFSLSKATMDYIYVPDADEELDEENREKFKILKENIMPEIEVVQMWYVNQLSKGTVYNYDKELRPKLYKRLREAVFVDPVHEMVRLDPVVFESDIEIIHKPEKLHTNRDVEIFERFVREGNELSPRLIRMYAKELMISGSKDNLVASKELFLSIVNDGSDEELTKTAYILLAEIAAVTGDATALLKYAMKDVAKAGSSEMCSILGAYYENMADFEEAAIWYYNARYETEPEMNLKYKTEIPLKGLVRVYTALGETETAKAYEDELNNILK